MCFSCCAYHVYLLILNVFCREIDSDTRAPCFSLSGVVLLLNTLPTLALNFSETWVFLSPKLQ